MIFIAGNMPMVSEIVPLLIVIELEQYDYAGATVVETVLAASFLLLLGINLLQRWTRAQRPDRRNLADACLGRSLSKPRRDGGSPCGPRGSDRRALAFLGLFLLLPLAAVFVEALRQGLGAYLAGITEPDALAAIRLTLLVAAIAVPLNVVFGIAAAWAIANSVQGQPADHADRSALLGLAGDRGSDLRPAVRRPGAARSLARRA